MNSVILVASDFTPAASKALEHAIFMAKKSNAKIHLLNICKSEADIPATKTKLEQQIKDANAGSIAEPLVRTGSYKNIPTVGEEIGAGVIFLGTHGAKGMQKIVGSNALSLVSNSKIPFIIVQQDSPSPVGFNKIIATVSFHFENKQKIKPVSVLAKYFNSEVSFIYSKVDDATKKKSLRNMKFMQQHLDKSHIKHHVHVSENKNFNADILTLGKEIDANLIAIMNMQTEDLLGTGIFGKNYEQDLIMNDAKIPVLIINPINTRVFS